MTAAKAIPQMWALRITAGMLMENLANKMYESLGACLWEIVRNGVVACMPNDSWKPKVGRVEILLVRNHPMNPKGMTLVVLDHGSGFTQPKIKLFCDIGQSLVDLATGSGSHGGAAQKRIGRWAALALNRGCAEDRNPETGFYVFTRTASAGPVRQVSMIPSEIERNQGLQHVEIDPSSTELGPQRNIKGSFTAVVIPNPVFNTAEEICEALRWFLPRKPDLMFDLQVDGKPMTPPPLAGKVVLVQDQVGGVEVYVDKVEHPEAGTGGIWFADAETGLRVAHAPRLLQHLPSVLCRSDLTGDIFIPGLLGHQDTSRSTLTPRFLRTPTWKKHVLYLSGQVVPRVNALLGEAETFGQSPIDRMARSIAERAAAIYGKPDDVTGPLWPKEGKPSDDDDTDEGGGGGARPPGPPRAPRGPRKSRVLPIRIGEKTYVLSRMQLSKLLLADVSPVNPSVIHLNSADYEAMPKGSAAQQEHFLLMLLTAVGRAEHPDDPRAVSDFVGEHRRRFL